MQSSPAALSAWQQLRSQHITCDKALKLLVDEEGIVNQGLLDKEVGYRFFREFPDRNTLPPVIPLLLWRNCYYLGCPITPTPEDIKKLSDRTFTEIQILPIAEKSYRAWYHTQNIDTSRINATPLVNPLTGEIDREYVAETTELSLSKAVDQISRIKTLISGALRNRASDIHLEPVPEGLRVRYRIDGILRDITVLPPPISRRVIVALKVMSNMDIAESRRPQDGRIGENYAAGQDAESSLDMRVSVLPCVGGEKAVIRLLPQENPFSQLEDLGFTQKTLEIYRGWLQQPQGLIILTGPTGSGKTSTLYTSLQTVATEHVNVVTIEDPVEYVLPRINQTQVHERAGMTFASGLRAILRQDPDIIMVGEIRDRDTAETAIRAALTGHLVFTTLHTNDALSAIPRLKDIGPDPSLISDALLGIIGQRLVRRVCPHCAEPYDPTPADLQALSIKPEEANLHAWRRGHGCSNCFKSGYMGREAVVEVLDVDDQVRQIIYEGNLSVLPRYLSQIGFASFREAAIAKITNGLTTLEEVQRVLHRSALARKFELGEVNEGKNDVVSENLAANGATVVV